MVEFNILLMMFCYFLYQKNEINEYNSVCKLPKLKRLNEYKTLPGIIYFLFKL